MSVETFSVAVKVTEDVELPERGETVNQLGNPENCQGILFVLTVVFMVPPWASKLRLLFPIDKEYPEREA